jgi:diguanylate cyclase (GGDEF)-like protein
MSFRLRLRLFFVVIVIVPMIAVALVLFRVVTDSESGKSDARLGTGLSAAQGLFQRYQREAADAAGRIGRDAQLATALAAGDREAVERRLRVAAADRGVVRVELRVSGTGEFVVGRSRAIAPARSPLEDAQGQAVGDIAASVATAATYSAEVGRLTGLEVVVSDPREPIATTLPAPPGGLPVSGAASLDGRDFRVKSFRAPSFDGSDLTVRLLADERDARSNISSSTAVVAAALLLFLVLAFGFALAVSRSLHVRIEELLQAAKRLGRGDFQIEVPTEGQDEFADLGKEFNAMARELERHIGELRHERGRLQEAIRRVGESFARGLDRDALLEIAVETAIDGVAADAGCAAVGDGSGRPLRRLAGRGDIQAQKPALDEGEVTVLETREPAETTLDDIHVLSEPLNGEDGDLLGVLTVSRSGREFSETDRELLHYLATQTAVSMENADLHHTVQVQAVTDELTGLANHRRFQEVMTNEVERARRYSQNVGLIMLDLDNFKRVNDTHGHRQGDLVLREVARVLKASAREIDEPARYGGEELAVVLPQTDLEGAFNFAERVRQGIESLDLPLLEEEGTLKVTASLGAASLAVNGTGDKDALVAAADAALYAAKRAGKNRTIRAG